MTETINKHRQEVIQIRNIYEEKIKNIDSELDIKQKSLYDIQNKLNITTIKYE